jgi:FAD/FMN-containing dehydrogenase
MKLNDHHEDTMSTLDTAISALKSGLSGRLILPGDADYDAARAVMYGGMDFHPAAIAKVRSSKDMQKVLAVSAENRIEVAVRSGGHRAPATAAPRAASSSTCAT